MTNDNTPDNDTVDKVYLISENELWDLEDSLASSYDVDLYWDFLENNGGNDGDFWWTRSHVDVDGRGAGRNNWGDHMYLMGMEEVSDVDNYAGVRPLLRLELWK